MKFYVLVCSPERLNLFALIDVLQIRDLVSNISWVIKVVMWHMCTNLYEIFSKTKSAKYSNN